MGANTVISAGSRCNPNSTGGHASGTVLMTLLVFGTAINTSAQPFIPRLPVKVLPPCDTVSYYKHWPTVNLSLFFDCGYPPTHLWTTHLSSAARCLWPSLSKTSFARPRYPSYYLLCLRSLSSLILARDASSLQVFHSRLARLRTGCSAMSCPRSSESMTE